ncbi:PLD nuclease N-terminal domain-containing protein [Lysinibacillus sp. CTST325]
MRKIYISIIGLFILVIAIFIYNRYFQSKYIGEKDIQREGFLADKQAILYFSTTADQDMFNGGVSLAVFLDDKGKTSAYKMNGLELGSIAVSEGNEEEVLLESKDKIRLIGDNYQEFEMKYQHTGEITGYLKQQNLYFSIYNSGIDTSTDAGGYNSNVIFGNEEGFEIGNIPYYILTSGVGENEVLILTRDLEKNLYDVRKVIFEENKVKVENMIQLKNEKNMEYGPSSSIVSDEKYYYIVLSEGDSVDLNSENEILFRINRETLEQERIVLATYKDHDNLISLIPYSTNNSTYLYENEFYYMNGLGEVFTLNKLTDDIDIKFTIENPSQDGVRHNEATFFKDDKLYVVRYDAKKKDKYYIEVYSLKSGKKVSEIQLEGLHAILTSVRGKSIHSYDFKMLK